MSIEPVAPIFPAAPHVECPVGPLRAWFIDPPGAIVQQSEVTEFTVEMARWLVGTGFELLTERYGIESGFSLVLDIRAMTTRDPIVRTVFMDKAREVASKFAMVAVIPPLRVKGVYLSALHAAAALVSAFGTKFEVTNDLDDLLTRYGLRAASH